MTDPILPGSVIGVMGGGQLGRMFAIAARRMGYRIHTFTPDEDSPTGQLADKEITAPFEDAAAVTAFASEADVVTFEFENVPAESIDWCSRCCVVRPSRDVLHITQNRLREKEFLSRAGIPVAPFRRIESAADLSAAVESLKAPAVLKFASFGYDGKGQIKINPEDQPVWNGVPCVFEQWIPFMKELSVMVARGVDGSIATFDVCENIHSNHILDVTIVPARVDERVQRKAEGLAREVAKKFELIGVMGVEMFLLDDDSLLINEVAPRPHNSGHFSFDACVTSQFEQQLRAVCGLALGATDLLRPVAMANLLGDLWKNGEPNWPAITAFPDVKLHLYGKAHPRPGRKMGHLIAFADTTDEALEKVLRARANLA
jgi:5-(carboxyamino)imidazole ribonucleotide synthase